MSFCPLHYVQQGHNGIHHEVYSFLNSEPSPYRKVAFWRRYSPLIVISMDLISMFLLRPTEMSSFFVSYLLDLGLFLEWWPCRTSRGPPIWSKCFERTTMRILSNQYFHLRHFLKNRKKRGGIPSSSFWFWRRCSSSSADFITTCWSSSLTCRISPFSRRSTDFKGSLRYDEQYYWWKWSFS